VKAPSTPYERALAHPHVTPALKQQLCAQYRTLDPVALLAEIRAAQEELGNRIDCRAGDAHSEQREVKATAPHTVQSSAPDAIAFAKRLGRMVDAGDPRGTYRRPKRRYKTRVRMPSKLDPHCQSACKIGSDSNLMMGSSPWRLVAEGDLAEMILNLRMTAPSGGSQHRNSRNRCIVGCQPLEPTHEYRCWLGHGSPKLRQSQNCTPNNTAHCYDRELASGGAATYRTRYRPPAERRIPRAVRKETAFDRAASAEVA
jgi:hypothetical protein